MSTSQERFFQLHKGLKRRDLESTCFILFFLLIVLITESVAGSFQTEDLLFPNSHFVTVEEVHLHYRLWNPEKQTAAGNILLVHGLGGSTYSWRYTVPALVENGYLVLAVDLPGFGLSQRRPAVRQSHVNRGNLLWKLIESMDICGPWHLVGHSMGGGVAVAMALQEPLNTASVTLAAGSIEADSRRMGKILSRCRPIRKITARVIGRLFLTRRRIKSFLRSAYGREPSAEEVAGYYDPLQLEKTYLTLESLLRKYPEDNDLSDRIGEIMLPVSGIWGRLDKWVPVEKGEELIQKINGASLSIIDDAAHCPMETHPEIFNHLLVDFLSKIVRDENSD